MFYLLLAVFFVLIIGCLLGSYLVQVRCRLIRETWTVQIRLMCTGKIFGLNWSACSGRPHAMQFILFWIPISFTPRAGRPQKKNKPEKRRGLSPIIRRGKQLKRMAPVTSRIRRLITIRRCEIQGETHFDPAVTGLIYLVTQMMYFFNIKPQIQLQPCFFPGDSSVSGAIDLQFSGISVFILAMKEWKTWRTVSKV
jgi:hypothetical protein